MKIIFFLVMIFCHIVDDYYFQGWLASAKQKKYWKENAPDEMYKYDYIWALIMHSFSWSFMIVLPVWLYELFYAEISSHWLIFAFNMLIHLFTDDLKCNKYKINLIIDQSIHIVQIIVTWVVLVL